MLAFVGDVLGEFGEEVEGFEYLKVARDFAEESRGGRFREWMAAFLFRFVNDLSGGGDADEPGEAERGAGDVLRQAFKRGAVAGFDDGAVTLKSSLISAAKGSGLLAARIRTSVDSVAHILIGIAQSAHAQGGGNQIPAVCGGDRGVCAFQGSRPATETFTATVNDVKQLADRIVRPTVFNAKER